jgi:hypothetical protein
MGCRQIALDETLGTNLAFIFKVQKALPLTRNGGAILLGAPSLHLKVLPKHGPTRPPTPFLSLRLGNGAWRSRHICEPTFTGDGRYVDHRRPIQEQGRDRQCQSIPLRDNAGRSYWPVRRDGIGHSIPRFNASNFSTGFDLATVDGIAQV